MLVECPSCRCRFTVNSGRPKSTLIVEKVIQQLRESQSLRKTAIILNIDRNTIYKILKYKGIDPKSITGRKYTKRSKENV